MGCEQNNTHALEMSGEMELFSKKNLPQPSFYGSKMLDISIYEQAVFNALRGLPLHAPITGDMIISVAKLIETSSSVDELKAFKPPGP
jgi:hypothetical protein